MNTPDSQRPLDRRAAFEEIVAAYEGALLRYAGRLLRRSDAAQDVVQDVFIRFYRSWTAELAPSPQVSSWLYRAAHNRAIDILRKEGRLSLLHARQAAESEDTVAPDRGAGFRVSDEAARAAGALRVLSVRERELVILKVYEEKSYKEIAEIMGLTVTNVGFILHHAMKKLAAELRAAPGGRDGNGP
jgi:RNA polymerase sigma factor (sigma-70 family)